MDFLECVKGRRSIRKFQDKPVEREAIERVILAASYSPTWKNSQTARYILIEDKALIGRIADECVMGFAFNADTLKRAPAVILVTIVTGRSGYEKDGSYSTSKGDRWEVFDAGIATQTLCLAAHAEGLGTVIQGIFNEDKVHQAAGVPQGQKVAAVIPIGYPAEAPACPKRKGVEELLSFR